MYQKTVTKKCDNLMCSKTLSSSLRYYHKKFPEHYYI